MMVMSVDGKGTVFPMNLKLEGNHLQKDTKRENVEKDIMHSIETNHQINMTFVHSVSSNTLFKRYFNAKSFKMFWKSWSTCPKHDVAGSVSVAMVMRTYKGDVKKKTQKNPHHQTVSAETSFDDDSDKEALNVHNVLPAIIEKKCI